MICQAEWRTRETRTIDNSRLCGEVLYLEVLVSGPPMVGRLGLTSQESIYESPVASGLDLLCRFDGLATIQDKHDGIIGALADRAAVRDPHADRSIANCSRDAG